MKILLGALSLLFFIATISCTKTNNVTTTIRDTTVVIHKDTTVIRDTVYEKSHLNPIVGLWIGKYLNVGEVDSFYYSFDIRGNSNCIASSIGSTNNSVATSGPWQLNNTNFTATLTELTNSPTPHIQAITATYDSTSGTLTGQWTYTQGTGPAGTFKMIRVPN